MSQLVRSPGSQIRAITFDVGGTLIQPWPSVGAVYAQVAAEQGIDGLLPNQLDTLFKTAWKASGGRAESREDWRTLVRKVFEGMSQVPDVDSLFEALYDRFTETRVWHVFEDVEPALEGLRHQGLRLGVISNWDERLRPLMVALRLAKYFESLTISCEVGCRKPEPEIFRRAATDLGLPVESVLHVGDSAEHDLQGALGAGMRAVLLRRGVRPPKRGIASLVELSGCLSLPLP